MSLAHLVCPAVDQMVAEAVASAPPLPADVRRRLAELIRANPTDRRGTPMATRPLRMVRTDGSATPSEPRTSGPRGEPAAGARAPDHPSALALTG